MILIVDDDVGMAETCRMLLEAHGFDVNLAGSGTEALSKARAAAHDLVISDYAMPGMTGIELGEHLKRDPLTAEIPILLMSASLRGELAGSTCYDAFLKKPFLAETLLIEVRRLLKPAAVPFNDYPGI
ncbi:response regulator [Massilia sp. R798]|uniref:Response regulator n=2 Tax=Massilia soli TaxID=2792854 RepID=A0ABS7SS31_9BURK|nr:response regulator [Massilia soli]